MLLESYLLLGAAVFAIGLFGALSKKSAILILLSVELMLNAVNINLIAFSNFITPLTMKGQIFSIFVIVVAACEVALGLAIVLMLYRRRQTLEVDKYNMLKG